MDSNHRKEIGLSSRRGLEMMTGGEGGRKEGGRLAVVYKNADTRMQYSRKGQDSEREAKRR